MQKKFTCQIILYKGPLYILISKDNPSEKYQFHFETSQFMDVKDQDIDLGEFMEDNEDVYQFFTKIKKLHIKHGAFNSKLILL